MSRREKEALKHGVVTASTGNHAQSIVYGASLFGVKATIVMPWSTPTEGRRGQGAWSRNYHIRRLL